MRAILLAGGLSLLFTLLGTRLAIRLLVAKGYGQLIRDDGPTTHHTKRGTPTMGGLVIIVSVVLVKASRGSRLDLVADALVGEPASDSGARP